VRWGVINVDRDPAIRYRLIRRAEFVDALRTTITSMPIQSGMAEKMTPLLLKSAALMGRSNWRSRGGLDAITPHVPAHVHS
jgi:hypothetical protein